MNDRPDPRLVKRLTVFASITALFSVLVGVSDLAGWSLHVASLTTWGAAPVTMVANTAVCFVLIGVSLWLRRRNTQPIAWVRKLTANTAAVIAGLAGLLSLSEHLFRLDLGIDELLLLAPPANRRPRFALASCPRSAQLPFCCLALLCWGSTGRRGEAAGRLSFSPSWPEPQRPSESSHLLLIPTSTGAHLSLALPTSVTLAVFSLGLVCARTDRGLGALLCNRSLGGSLARRLLLAAFVPLLVGGVRWQVTSTGRYFRMGHSGL